MAQSRVVSRFFCALLVVLVAQVAAPSIVLAYEEGRTEYGARLRLTSLPARMHFDAPVPDFLDGGQGALLRAIATWNARSCSSPVFVSSDDEDDILIEIRPIVENWKYGQTIAAHTAIESDPFQGDIRHVIIEINARRKWSDQSIVPPDALDLESVFLHELGHAVGLGHSRHQDAIMRAGIKPGQARRILHEDDAAGLCAVAQIAKTNVWRSDWVLAAICPWIGILLVVANAWHDRKARRHC